MTYISIQKKINVLGILFLCLMGLATVLHTNHGYANDLEGQIKAAQEQINAQNDQKLKEQDTDTTNAPIVIELFTSSDCSACIYADRLLYDATQKDNVIGLSCYITDSQKFNDEKNSVSENESIDQCVFRQWAYLSGTRSGYGILNTPEFVFGGEEKIVSGNLTEFDSMLESKRSKYNNTVLSVFIEWKDENTLKILLPKEETTDQGKIKSSVYLVRYKDMMVEKMEEGVNKGRVLRFSNVVQNIQHIGKWHGAERVIEIDVPVPEGGKEKGGYAILLQEMLGEKILAAGKISDYKQP